MSAIWLESRSRSCDLLQRKHHLWSIQCRFLPEWFVRFILQYLDCGVRTLSTNAVYCKTFHLFNPIMFPIHPLSSLLLLHSIYHHTVTHTERIHQTREQVYYRVQRQTFQCFQFTWLHVCLLFNKELITHHLSLRALKIRNIHYEPSIVSYCIVGGLYRYFPCCDRAKRLNLNSTSEMFHN